MKKISPMEVGERIRSVRGKRTQTEFAEAIGVKKQNYISRYERGRIPSPDLLVRIARMGRVSTDWLLTGKQGRENMAGRNGQGSGQSSGRKNQAGRKRA
ncbi:MAG: helix-turn-helix transcriptional regulator [Nitrospirae bacterium]|nr:helix-turn-helix transcriptional regulator [Candidatus Manganitrophaceae bacterium]